MEILQDIWLDKLVEASHDIGRLLDLRLLNKSQSGVGDYLDLNQVESDLEELCEEFLNVCEMMGQEPKIQYHSFMTKEKETVIIERNEHPRAGLDQPAFLFHTV